MFRRRKIRKKPFEKMNINSVDKYKDVVYTVGENWQKLFKQKICELFPIAAGRIILVQLLKIKKGMRQIGNNKRYFIYRGKRQRD